MNRTLANQIRKALMERHSTCERVRFRRGEIHWYGVGTNTTDRGWWFADYVVSKD